MSTLALVGALAVGSAGALLVRSVVGFQHQQQAARKRFEQAAISRLGNAGVTRSLQVLPLIDWHTGASHPDRESGISYLIRTDRSDILFDCGLNLKAESPSPLLRNMNRLGVGLDDFDTVVISHNHMDHVGGLRFQKSRTFSLDAEQVPLVGKRAFVPVPMDYPGLDCKVAREPEVISSGVVLTGAIENHLYLMGGIAEQALAVVVEGKGVVLIVGCGHQTLLRLLARVKQLFDEPLYGVIGGLHLPYGRMHGNIRILGRPVQRYLGTGKLPWSPISRRDVQDGIDLLEQAEPQIVALSPHDSSEATIELFHQAFAGRYHKLAAGVVIDVA